jgi:hypothetical protein
LASGKSEQAELPGQPSELPTFDAVSEEKVESVGELDDVGRNGNGAPESPVESAEEQAEARDPEEHEGNRFEMVIQSHANESAPPKPEKDNFEVSFEENEDDAERPQEPPPTPIVTPVGCREKEEEDFGLSLEFPDMG